MARKNLPLPREAVIDRMCAVVNGMTEPDPRRYGYMSRDRAASTIDLFKGAFSNPLSGDSLSEGLQKSVTVNTGLTYYDLRAPALNLFPTVTPLRNTMPRQQRQYPGDALHYKAVTAVTGSGFPYMGWVPEGQRSASVSYTTKSVTVPYVTLGEEDSLTEEARFAAEGFEDEDALVQLRLLLKMFVKEEAGLLGGNASLTLSAPSAPTLTAAGTGATLPTGTYSVIAVALTQEGYLNSSVSGGVATTLNITGNDGQTYTLNGGSSAASTNATQAITAGQTLSASVPVVSGAVAYAWYVGAAGSEKLQSITTINSATFAAALLSSTQAATAVAADHSGNSTYAFDGLLTTTFKNAALNPVNAYVKSMATGTAGTGTGLTASGSGGIDEIDDMFVFMWDNFEISPTVIYVNAQELRNITKKMLTNTSGPLLRYNVGPDEAGMPEYKLTASGVVAFYFNPFTADGGMRIPVKIHPTIAPGTLMAWAEFLPPWYVSNATPEVAVVQTRQDYYAEVWPKTTRAQFYGIYTQEALSVFAPFSCGVLNNIGNV